MCNGQQQFLRITFLYYPLTVQLYIVSWSHSLVTIYLNFTPYKNVSEST